MPRAPEWYTDVWLGIICFLSGSRFKHKLIYIKPSSDLIKIYSSWRLTFSRFIWIEIVLFLCELLKHQKRRKSSSQFPDPKTILLLNRNRIRRAHKRDTRLFPPIESLFTDIYDARLQSDNCAKVAEPDKRKGPKIKYKLWQTNKRLINSWVSARDGPGDGVPDTVDKK